LPGGDRIWHGHIEVVGRGSYLLLGSGNRKAGWVRDPSSPWSRLRGWPLRLQSVCLLMPSIWLNDVCVRLGAAEVAQHLPPPASLAVRFERRCDWRLEESERSGAFRRRPGLKVGRFSLVLGRISRRRLVARLVNLLIRSVECVRVADGMIGGRFMLIDGAVPAV